MYLNITLFEELIGKNIKSLNNKDEKERVSFLISLVLIHENGSHLKIQNIIKQYSPRYYYLSNFKISLFKERESRFVIDCSMFEKDLLEQLYEINDFSLKLKNINLFVDKDFTELKKLITIKEDIISESKKLNSISFKHKIVKCLRKIFIYRKLLFKCNVIEDWLSIIFKKWVGKEKKANKGKIINSFLIV